MERATVSLQIRGLSVTVRFLIFVAGSVLVTNPVFSQQNHITGKVVVTDGDTLRMGEIRIRMHGIDAPEKAQTCIKAMHNWQCGQASRAALIAKVGDSNVNCVIKDIDRYKRLVGECFIGKLNLNRWMVSEGWAVAYRKYSQDYIKNEELARQSRTGIWSSEFQLPSEWRKSRRH